MIVVQVQLRHDTNILVTYVEKVRKLKVGTKITLKDHEHPEWWWHVEALYADTEIDSEKLHTDWRVGGLE